MLIIRLIILKCVISAAMIGCAQVPPAQRANYEGNLAYYDKRYDDALSKYEASRVFAEKEGDKQYKAIAMFGLARTYAQLCREKEADNWFKQSITIRETLPDTDHAYITQNYLEYGRFLASYSRKVDAVGFYDQAIPLLESVNIETEDPLGYALVLDEYIQLLQAAGRRDEASRHTDRARMIRESNKGRTAQFRPEPYPDCESRGIR